jgi:hypothetical protein
MNDQRSDIERALTGEEGHADVGLLSLVGAAGGIALGIGIAADNDILGIIGGAGVAVGILLGGVLRHRTIDYDVYRRLENLEKK